MQANWAQTSSSADDFIKNKPTLGAAASKGVDSAPTASSTNLVTSGGVATALAAKLNTADVDAALSSTSTNPVQNKAVQAPISRLVDAGAKNLFKNTAQSQVVGGVTFTVNLDGYITANGTKTNNDWLYLSTGNSLPSGTYVLSSGLAPRENVDVRTLIATADSLGAAIMSAEGQNQVVTRSFSQSYSNLIYAIRISGGTTVSNLVFKPMLCTAEDYAISPEFVPYAPSNRELYEEKISLDGAFGLGTTIAESADLNELTSIGSYYTPSSSIAATLINAPSGLQVPSMIRLEVKNTNGTNRYMQILYSFDIGSGKTSIYIRQYTANGWLPWYKFEGTAVT